MNKLLKYRCILPLMAFILFGLQGCYKDKGNYDYNTLPEDITIDDINSSYSFVFGDSLAIDPTITYAGNASDLSYEWERFRTTPPYEYESVYEGKKLVLKCGSDEIFKNTGFSTFRLAVRNNKLASDTDSPDANQIYSSNISISVMAASYRGLMVLHGNSQQCDVGLIETDVFLPGLSDHVTMKVTPDFYSHINGEKIPGEGKQVFKYGWYYAEYNFGTSNVYIFTDQGGVQTDYVMMEKTAADYTAMYTFPSFAYGKPQKFTPVGRANGQAMIDDGRLWYRDFSGPFWYNGSLDSYYLAPYIAMTNSYGISRGAVVFDTISQAFLYCAFQDNTSALLEFPDNTVTGVNVELNDMKASLLYLETKGLGGSTTPTTQSSIYDAIAIMKDDASGEKYLLDLNIYNSDASQIAIGRYSMENLPGVNEMKFYAFGAAINENYYATGQTIYKYLFLSNNTANVAWNCPAGEEITMMKILKMEDSANNTYYYQFTNRIMAVATVNAEGQGKIYTFMIDQVTGDLTLAESFDGTESGGNHFERIYDADLKNQ